MVRQESNRPRPSSPLPTKIRELDRRRTGRVDVRLRWDSLTDRVLVSVTDERANESLRFDVDPAHGAPSLPGSRCDMSARRPRPRPPSRRTTSVFRSTATHRPMAELSLVETGRVPADHVQQSSPAAAPRRPALAAPKRVLIAAHTPLACAGYRALRPRRLHGRGQCSQSPSTPTTRPCG